MSSTLGTNAASPPTSYLRLAFEGGTLLIEGLPEEDARGIPGIKFDPRTNAFRAQAIWYRTIVEYLRANKIAYVDEARAYGKSPTPWPIRIDKPAFPHQVQGLENWWKAGGRGVVVLPTGTGKTHLANLAIERAARPALVITPTIDLLNQWYDELTVCFGTEVGLLGGGYNDIKPLTVTTYDSAYLNMERLGDRFGLVIFDECHHLPSPTYGQAAI
jgi:superfamily II DNA or RNA helicase